MDELEALERAGWDALSTREGAAFYERVMADDGVMLFPMGLFDRAASLDAIRSAPPWASYQLQSIGVSHPATDVGIVVYRAVAQREGEEPYIAWMSSTYVRDSSGAWRMALHQQSPG
jgi:hypothetical protein